MAILAILLGISGTWLFIVLVKWLCHPFEPMSGPMYAASQRKWESE